jgi:uncharacterized protein (TIGR03083 family)
MINLRPSPGSSPPARLLLQTAGRCDLDPQRLIAAFAGQRRRFVAVLDGFGADDWAAPTRCAAWSAQEVVRHLCDANAIGIAIGPDDGTLDVAEGFDPRTSPRRWLASSAGESPGATLDRFTATTSELFSLARDRVAEGRRFDVRLPYGPMDWTVLLLHCFWDSWIHERDVLLARGEAHPTDGAATAYAAAYGLFIAATVASMFGSQIHEKLRLSGDGGGVFEVDGRGGVTFTVPPVTGAGPCAAEVTDALAGRVPLAAVLPELPGRSCAALSRMADFFHTPVRP